MTTENQQPDAQQPPESIEVRLAKAEAEATVLREQLQKSDLEVANLEEKTEILGERLEEAVKRGALQLLEIEAQGKRIDYLLFDRDCLLGTVAHLIRQADLVDGRATPQPTPMGRKIEQTKPY